MTRDTPTTSSRWLVSALAAMLAALAVWSMVPAAAHADVSRHQRQARVRKRAQRLPRRQRPLHDGNDGTAQTRITSLDLDELNPAWSPNGHQDRVRAQHRAALRHLGRERRRLQPGPADHHDAPTTRGRRGRTRGKKIVFASDRNSAPGIYDLFVDGLERGEPGQPSRTPRRSTRTTRPGRPTGRRSRSRATATSTSASPNGTQPDAADHAPRRTRSSRTGPRPPTRSSTAPGSTPSTRSGR